MQEEEIKLILTDEKELVLSNIEIIKELEIKQYMLEDDCKVKELLPLFV